MPTILVIEDTEELRDDIIEILKLNGLTAIGVGNGQEGIDKAQQIGPDLILCDIRLPDPELDGYAVLKRLRQDSSLAITPFIFLTAMAEKQDIRYGMELGVDDYITKPFAGPALLKAIHAQLEKREMLSRLYKQKLDEIRENLMSMLPHELRTPLTSIMGFSDILVADCRIMNTDQIIEVGTIINKAAHRLYRLFENYLLYSQLEIYSRESDLTKVLPVSTTASPRKIIESQSRDKAERANRAADLVLDLDNVSAIAIFENYLRRIIEELLDNAFKFSALNAIVEVTARCVGNQYVIRVTDHGRGMKANQIRDIGLYMQFDRKVHEQQGTGMGLAIVQQLCNLYNGKMTIESIPEQQTTVSIFLPLV